MVGYGDFPHILFEFLDFGLLTSPSPHLSNAQSDDDGSHRRCPTFQLRIFTVDRLRACLVSLRMGFRLRLPPFPGLNGDLSVWFAFRLFGPNRLRWISPRPPIQDREGTLKSPLDANFSLLP